MKDKYSTKRRPTFGFLIDWTDSAYHLELSRGVEDFAKENNINIFYFEGGILTNKNETLKIRNTLYTIAGKENVDGLLILSGAMAQNMKKEDFFRFCHQYNPLPIVSINMTVPGVPSVDIENKAGLHDLIVHLVRDHEYKHLVYISGPQFNEDSIERLTAFNETLDELGIKVDDSMIFHGSFLYESGEHAVREFLDNRKLPVDCIVAANDGMAFGALNELKKRGIHVPLDTAVVGFDDVDICKSSDPMLTTVRQPLYELGYKAAKVLFRIIKGEEVAPIIVIKTIPVIRESCGCFLKYDKSVNPEIFKYPGMSGPEIFRKNEDKIKNHIFTQLREIEKKGAPVIPAVKKEKLFVHLLGEIAGNKDGEFLVCWDDVLNYILVVEESLLYAHEYISAYRDSILPYINERNILINIDTLFQAAILRASQRRIQKEKHNLIKVREEWMPFIRLRDSLLYSPELSHILSILTDHLPEIGIKCFYLSLFDNNQKNPYQARLILAVNDTRRIPLAEGGVLFDSRTLIPPEFLPVKSRNSMLVQILIHKQEKLGYIVLELTPRYQTLYTIYSDFQMLISHTLQVGLLFEEIKIQRNNLKEQKERLASNLSKLRKTMGGIIQTMSMIVEIRDPYTAGHQRRVADLARSIATEMKLESNRIEAVRMAGIIHDLGKIYIPADILNRPGKLDELEFGIIKKHPQLAYDILKNIEFPWPIAEIILQHHERINGSGYPRGLHGEEISIEAKIISIADVVEAMASFRPYRKELGIDCALDEIMKNSRILYDADVVDACINIFTNKGYVLIK